VDSRSSRSIDQIAGIYPNPTTGNIMLILDGEHDVEYQVQSLDGIPLINGVTEGQSAQIEMEHLENGVYLIQLISSNELLETKKIIKL